MQKRTEHVFGIGSYVNQVATGVDGSPIVNGTAIDTSNMDYMTAQGVVTGTIAGALKLQGSNDKVVSDGQTPVNWNDIVGATVTISSATSAFAGSTTNIFQLAYQWIRSVWTPTSVGTQTVTTVADVSGSLNSKYFLLDDAGSAHKYYVWFNINSAGVDPLVAGRTAVPITGATNVSANTLATSLRVAIAALNGAASFSTGGANAAVIITNLAVGAFVPAVDGAAPTGFTFATSADVGTILCQIHMHDV